jgi:hypothetical protein
MYISNNGQQFCNKLKCQHLYTREQITNTFDVHGGINSKFRRCLLFFSYNTTVVFWVVTWCSLVLVLSASFYNTEGIIMGAFVEGEVRYLCRNI